MTALKARWLSWGDLPWLSRSEAGGGIVQLAERLLEASLEASTSTSFLHRRLPEITTEFSAQWCSVYKRTPQWTRVAETGVPDQAYQAARLAFEERELVDLTIAIGLMNAYNRMAISFRNTPQAALEQ